MHHTDPKDICRDPEVVKQYIEDPLVHPWAAIHTLADVAKKGTSLLKKNAATFELPILITHGLLDVMTDPIASKEFIDAIPSKDKTFEGLEGYYHECHNEPGKEKDVVINMWADWIVKRAK